MSRPQLVDCPECACLIDAEERSCPFCGAVPKRVAMSSLLSLGFMLGLASASCGEKDAGTQGSESSTGSSSGTDTMSTDSTVATTTTATTTNPTEGGMAAYAAPEPLPEGTTFGSSVAYAGPPDTDTEADTEAATTETTDVPGTTAYAGPASTTTGGETDTDTDTGTTSPLLPGASN